MSKQDLKFLADEKFKLIGFIEKTDDTGDLCYLNVIITLDGGKVVAVETQDYAYTKDDVINDAYGWIDQHYWSD